MALRIKKDIKKASYYVWFLGAQESRGLRGDEFAIPAVRYLEQRANDLEPFKVTLQVSHKGLKIIQNVQNKGKQQTIKHFIPHSSITSAVVQGDIVACVLLLYNPLTGCPVHVHAYRCDSEHTSEILYSHLQALIDRPENQKKFAEIERKLQLRGALTSGKKPPDSSLGSEVSTRESDSASNEERSVANLYDSLAAELKQKLSTGKKGVAKSPILLPPRDYDTVHRQKGNLSNIDTRRCLNQNIVGVNARRKLESSGGSSGIGSDLAPSPERNEYARQHDNHSTSEEDWAESTAYMMHEAFDPTPRRPISPPRHSSPPQRHSSPPRRAISPLQRHSSPPRRAISPLQRHSSPPRRAISPLQRHSSPPRRAISPLQRHSSPPRRAISPQRHFSPHRRSSPPRRTLSPQRAINTRRYDQGFDETDHSYRDQLAPFRDHAFERRFRHESLENVTKHDYDDQYRRRYAADTKRREDRDEKPRAKLQRGVSESSLKVPDVSPKDRFNVAKEKFMNLERERFNRELEQQMAIRRSMLERNCRSPSPDNERIVDRREERLERQERAHREIERLPRVGRKRDEVKRYEYGSEEFLDREKPRREEYRYKERRELDRRIEEDEIIEPVIDDRRREWNDRQRAFSRSRLLEDQRQYPEGKSYYDRDYRDFRDIPERNQAKFRHSYAEPIPRGRLGTVRPY